MPRKIPPMEDLAAFEKIWLLAGELLRDEGVEEVNARHMASVLGQALACVAVHDTINPLDQRTMMHVLDQAEESAMRMFDGFVESLRDASAG